MKIKKKKKRRTVTEKKKTEVNLVQCNEMQIEIT